MSAATPSTVRARYDRLASDSQRTSVLHRARDCSALTIPSLLPPQGNANQTTLPVPWTSFPARCVNNLSARLLLVLFPPNHRFFKLALSQSDEQEMFGDDKEMARKVREALGKGEDLIMADIESLQYRPVLIEALRHLLVTGNVIVYVREDGQIKLYRLDCFVIKRSPTGEPLEMIVKEKLSRMEMPAEVQDKVPRKQQGHGSTNSDADDIHELYTRIYRGKTHWGVQQEVEGVIISDEQAAYPLDACPWHAPRLVKVPGDDYGGSLCGDYLGDFQTLDSLSRALTMAAAAASRVVYMVRPGGTTRKVDLQNAQNLDVIDGNPDDISTLQLDKTQDMRVASDAVDRLQRQLAAVFLLNSALQRDAERVTAEEIRMLAQELEVALGGVYSSLSQELQLPLLSVVMRRLEKAGRLPELPRDLIRPIITTGVSGLGRNADRNALVAFLTDLQAVFGPQVAASVIDISEVTSRLAVSHGVDTKGLVKSNEELSQQQEAAQQQEILGKVAGPAVNQMGAMLREGGGAGS